jgi:hypothetical protein
MKEAASWAASSRLLWERSYFFSDLPSIVAPAPVPT